MEITFKGQPIQTSGQMPKVGSRIPEFSLIKPDLSTISLKDFQGRNLILNVFLSLDTEICAQSVRKFNEQASQLKNTNILCVSMDLPFASKRFCSTENIENVIPASAFRHPEFGKNYGLTLTDGPLQGLLARAVLVADGQGKLIYAELVPEITQEPNYQAVLEAAKKLLH